LPGSTGWLIGRNLIFIAAHETGAFGIMQKQIALMISPLSIIASASSSVGSRISISSPSLRARPLAAKKLSSSESFQGSCNTQSRG
jgi:hypothetical protein